MLLKLIVGLSLTFQVNIVFACIEHNHFYPLSAVVVGMFFTFAFTCLLTVIAKGFHKIFLSQKYLFSLIKVTTSILSVLIGLFGSLAIPQYRYIFEDFGNEIPIHTYILVRSNHLLWLPSLLLIVLFIKSKYCSNINRYLKVLLFSEVLISILVFWSLYSVIFVIGTIC